MLKRERRVVDGAPIDARRRTGLEARGTRRDLAQPLRQRQRRGIAGAPAGLILKSDMDPAGQEGADRQHHIGRLEHDAARGDDAAHAAAFDTQVGRFLLEQGQLRLVFEHRADGAR